MLGRQQRCVHLLARILCDHHAYHYRYRNNHYNDYMCEKRKQQYDGHIELRNTYESVRVCRLFTGLNEGRNMRSFDDQLADDGVHAAIRNTNDA